MIHNVGTFLKIILTTRILGCVSFSIEQNVITTNVIGKYCYHILSVYFICETNENLPDETLHQWHQVSDNDWFDTDVAKVPPQHGSKSTFVIQTMKFDNNTEFFGIMRIADKRFSTKKTELKLLSKSSYMPYTIDKEIRYSELNEVNFDCSNYLLKSNHVYVGLIDPTGDSISTYRYSKLQRRFDMTYNQSMFCCVYYVTIFNNFEIVRRQVGNITLLVYEEQVTKSNSLCEDAHQIMHVLLTMSVFACACAYVASVIGKKALETDAFKNQALSLPVRKWNAKVPF